MQCALHRPRSQCRFRGAVSQALATKTAAVYNALAQAAFTEAFPLTLRDLCRAANILCCTGRSEAFRFVLELVFAPQYRDEQDAARAAIARALGRDGAPSLTPAGQGSSFGKLLKSTCVTPQYVFVGVYAEEAELPRSVTAPIYVVTERVVALWRQLLEWERTRTPVLVVGEGGCGKSEAVRAYVAYRRHQQSASLPPLVTVALTPGTDVVDLIGRMCLDDGGRDFHWEDGPVLRCFSEGHWLVLDDIAEAATDVIARLYPLLDPDLPVLFVPERGSALSHARAPSFWVLATASDADALPPALQNRLAICRFEAGPALAGISQAYAAPLPQEFRDAALWVLHTAPAPVAMQHQLRFLQCVMRLQALGPAVPPERSLQALLGLVVQGGAVQALDAPDAGGFGPYLQLALGLPLRAPLPWPPRLHTVTPRWYAIGGAVCLAMLCDLPVVLQGPGSTGKRHFLRLLAQYRAVLVPDRKETEPEPDSDGESSGGDADPAAASAPTSPTSKPDLAPGPAAGPPPDATLDRSCLNRLEAVAATAGTTVFDYFGGYVGAPPRAAPALDGPLTRALRTGACFLAADLHRASPAVLAALQPVLEGRAAVPVPGTRATVPRHPAFCFFATRAAGDAAPPHPRCVVLEVPAYDGADVAAILRGRVAARFPECPPQRATAVAVFMADHAPPDAALQHHLKWLRRLGDDAVAGANWRAHLLRHGRLLFPASATLADAVVADGDDSDPEAAGGGAEDADAAAADAGAGPGGTAEAAPDADRDDADCDAALRIAQATPDRVEFEMHGLTLQVPGRLGASALFRGAPLPLPLRRALVALAFAVCAPVPEPVVLLGPAAHAALCVRVLTDVLHPDPGAEPHAGAHPLLKAVPLSRLSDNADLVGAVQPLTRDALLGCFAARCGAAAVARAPPHPKAGTIAALQQRLTARGFGEGVHTAETERLLEETRLRTVSAQVALDLQDVHLESLYNRLQSMGMAEQVLFDPVPLTSLPLRRRGVACEHDGPVMTSFLGPPFLWSRM